ncbi:MAG: hypothetical protein KY452_12220 [Actinobacteria bacterium]|nr:hypothetical protein [Actinomycetota bacterium]
MTPIASLAAPGVSGGRPAGVQLEQVEHVGGRPERVADALAALDAVGGHQLVAGSRDEHLAGGHLLAVERAQALERRAVGAASGADGDRRMRGGHGAPVTGRGGQL